MTWVYWPAALRDPIHLNRRHAKIEVVVLPSALVLMHSCSAIARGMVMPQNTEASIQLDGSRSWSH